MTDTLTTFSRPRRNPVRGPRRSWLIGQFVAAVLALGVMAGPGLAHVVVIERVNVMTAPGVFSPAILILQGAPSGIIRLDERGLTRATYWDDSALEKWAAATFGGRARIYEEPDIPESND